MNGLQERKLADVIKERCASGKYLLGICLGAQMLMTESHEFGTTKGLDIIRGTVRAFPDPKGPLGSFECRCTCCLCVQKLIGLSLIVTSKRAHKYIYTFMFTFLA